MPAARDCGSRPTIQEVDGRPQVVVGERRHSRLHHHRGAAVPGPLAECLAAARQHGERGHTERGVRDRLAGRRRVDRPALDSVDGRDQGMADPRVRLVRGRLAQRHQHRRGRAPGQQTDGLAAPAGVAVLEHCEQDLDAPRLRQPVEVGRRGVVDLRVGVDGEGDHELGELRQQVRVVADPAGEQGPADRGQPGGQPVDLLVVVPEEPRGGGAAHQRLEEPGLEPDVLGDARALEPDPQCQPGVVAAVAGEERGHEDDVDGSRHLGPVPVAVHGGRGDQGVVHQVLQPARRPGAGIVQAVTGVPASSTCPSRTRASSTRRPGPPPPPGRQGAVQGWPVPSGSR